MATPEQLTSQPVASTDFTRRAGTPAYNPSGAQSCVTTAPAATTQPRPTVTPGSTVTRAPSQTPSSISTGSPRTWPSRRLLGPMSWVDVRRWVPGPIPTSLAIRSGAVPSSSTSRLMNVRCPITTQRPPMKTSEAMEHLDTSKPSARSTRQRCRLGIRLDGTMEPSTTSTAQVFTGHHSRLRTEA